MKILHQPLLSLLSLCFFGAPPLTHGASVTVVNPGFESPPIAPGSFSTTAPPPGWMPYGNLDFGYRTIGVLHPATTQLYTAPVPEGNNVGVVFLQDNPADPTLFTHQEAGLVQTLGATLQTSTRYTLRVHVGNIGNDPNPPHNQFSFGGFPGYRIDLLAGGVPVISDGALLPPDGQFQEAVIQVDIPPGHPGENLALGIRLVNLNAALGLEVNFDDVRLDEQPLSAWSDLGHGKPGSFGVPLLVGSGVLTAGSSNQLALSQVPAATVAHLIVGFSAVSTPFLGGTLVPSPLLVLPLPTSPTGDLVLPFAWPATAPAATSLYLQFWIADSGASLGVSASNAVTGVSS